MVGPCRIKDGAGILQTNLVHPRTVMFVELPGLRRHTGRVTNWNWWLEGEGPWLAVLGELEQLSSWTSFQFITFVFCLPKPKLVRIAGFLKSSSKIYVRSSSVRCLRNYFILSKNSGLPLFFKWLVKLSPFCDGCCVKNTLEEQDVNSSA